MNLLPKTKLLSRKINKISAIGLVVCSALTTSLLPFESSRETKLGNPTYNNTNNLRGFIGKYQFGEALLIDIGYYQANSYYGQPGFDKNYWRGTWTGKHGINSKEDFLNNKNNVQEIAIQEAMQYKWGMA